MGSAGNVRYPVEHGAKTIDWGTYEPYDYYHAGVFGPWHELPRSEARAEFKRLMAAKPARIEQLRQLLKANGVELSDTDDGLLRLDEWFLANVRPDPDFPGVLLPEWYSVAIDLVLFLGEVMMSRRPDLYWEFYIWGKRNVSYQEPVIMGLSTSTPKLNMNLGGMVAAYGHRIVASRGSIRTYGKVNVRGVEIDVDAAHARSLEQPLETNQFLRWVKIATKRPGSVLVAEAAEPASERTLSRVRYDVATRSVWADPVRLGVGARSFVGVGSRVFLYTNLEMIVDGIKVRMPRDRWEVVADWPDESPPRRADLRLPSDDSGIRSVETPLRFQTNSERSRLRVILGDDQPEPAAPTGNDETFALSDRLTARIRGGTLQEMTFTLDIPAAKKH